jgi:hypothetical protein
MLQRTVDTERYKRESKRFTLIERANRIDLVLDLRKEYANRFLVPLLEESSIMEKGWPGDD